MKLVFVGGGFVVVACQDLCEGGDLLMTYHFKSEREAANIVLKVTNAVRYMHDRNIAVSGSPTFFCCCCCCGCCCGCCRFLFLLQRNSGGGKFGVFCFRVFCRGNHMLLCHVFARWLQRGDSVRVCRLRCGRMYAYSKGADSFTCPGHVVCICVALASYSIW